MRCARSGSARSPRAINRSENGDDKPFGSAFWHNSARATWFVTSQRLPDGSVTVWFVQNQCANSRACSRRSATRSEFSDTSNDRHLTNVADVDDLAGQLPLWQRIAHFRQRRAARLTDIAILEAKPESVKKAIPLTRARTVTFAPSRSARREAADRACRAKDRRMRFTNRDNGPNLSRTSPGSRDDNPSPLAFVLTVLLVRKVTICDSPEQLTAC